MTAHVAEAPHAYRNSEFESVISAAVADGKSALVTALSLKAAKYTSYTALISFTNAGSTTKPMIACLGTIHV
jgi:hypothetical protein